MAAKQICILQTSFAKREDTVDYLKQHLPEVQVTFITDDTLLSDVRRNDGPDASVYARMQLYAQAAVLKGADLILNSCSSVGEVADAYAKSVSIPVLRIDAPMCLEAARLGTKIALISTISTSMTPIQHLIEHYAAKEGKTVCCKRFAELEAWDALVSGDIAKHNSLLITAINALDQEGYDAIVMTQVSMRVLLPELQAIKTPLLCAFNSGLDAVIETIRNMP